MTERLCKIKHCNSSALLSGFCTYHEWEVYRNSIQKKMLGEKCVVEGCNYTTWWRSGFCRVHFHEKKEFNPQYLEKIRVTSNKSALIREVKRQKKEQRVQDMFKMYKSGKTLDQVGEHFKVTRERVRQLISVLPDYSANSYKNETKIRACVRCFDPIPPDRKSKYCSLLCKSESRKKTPEEIERKKEHHRAVVRKNYHEKYKHDPRHREMQKEYTRRYQLKLKSQRLREKAENMAKLNNAIENNPKLQELIKNLK